MKNHLHSSLPRHLLTLLSGMVILCGCAQLSSFQTGRTSGKGNGEAGLAISASGITDAFETDTRATFFVGEAYGRYGVGENFDIGLKLSTGLTGVFDFKYQFIGDKISPFAMSIGPGIGFQGAIAETALVQLHLPVHMSYHPNEKLAVYASPRYIAQVITGEGSANYLGSSIGFESGDNVRFGLEASYFRLLNDTEVDGLGVGLFQFGGGVKFRIFGDN
ncbi:MAG: hypothetical protein KDC80_14935 [Saprospiraceae bacterium]|nr:hypothetical protein [Saprospiraceae bacterium]